MAFPPVLLSILLVAILGTGLHSVIAAIVVIDWTRFCRVVRTEARAQAQMDYVVAARTIGFSRPAILFREILPDVMPVLIALLTLEMGIAVVVEAILSFVGLSVSSDTPTWGGMIAEGRQIVHEAWWVLAAPLTALFATVVAFNQLGDGLARSLRPGAAPMKSETLAWRSKSSPRFPRAMATSRCCGRSRSRRRRRSPRPGRRERRRQVDHRQGDPRHHSAQVKVTGGRIAFEGRDLLALPPRELREILGRDIALIPQDPSPRSTRRGGSRRR